MRSKWYDLKPAVIALRRNGKSLSFIETNLGIPRSTLSLWCKEVPLSDLQREELQRNSRAGLSKARLAAARRHNEDKVKRIKQAEEQASRTLHSLKIDSNLVKLALAMLYWGEGKKQQTTALGSTDPEMLLFLLTALETAYGISTDGLIYELHLRHDQNDRKEIEYWSTTLTAPAKNFTRVYYDKRTESKATRADYHGICTIYSSNIAVQRELVYLYKSFSRKIRELRAISSLG